MDSGFNYKLNIPKKLDLQKNLQLYENQNVLNLIALKVKAFSAVLNAETAHVQISEDKVLLLSRISALDMVAELVPLDRNQVCPENRLIFKLQKPFTSNHQISLVFADAQKQIAYFCTQSYFDMYKSNDDHVIDYVHFLKVFVEFTGKLSAE
jgi:hypothetical protein